MILTRSVPFRILLACVGFTCIILSYQIGRMGVQNVTRRGDLAGKTETAAVNALKAKVNTQEEEKANAGVGTRALLSAERTDAVGVPLPPSTFTDDTWEVQKRNPYMTERNITCGDGTADAFNMAGIDLVHEVVHQDIHVPDEIPTLTRAVEQFDKAIEAAPNCQSALINKAIVCFVLKTFEAGVAAVQKAASIEGPLKHKARLWETIFMEQDAPNGGPARARNQIREVLKERPEYGLEYYGVRARDILENNPNAHLYLLTTEVRYSPYSLQCIQKAMSRYLMAKEFSAFFGGYPVISAAEARAFPEKWYIAIRNMLPPYILQVAQDFYSDMIIHGQLANTDPQAKRFVSHNDPPARFLMAQYNDMITRLADRLTKPTYTYFGSYYGASVLHPHRDRLQCEFTLSLNIDINPRQSQCPLGFSPYAKTAAFDFRGGRENMPPSEERVYVYHRPGDAVLIKGRNIIHWRDQMPPNFNCSQVFLHYVYDDFGLTLS